MKHDHEPLLDLSHKYQIEKRGYQALAMCIDDKRDDLNPWANLNIPKEELTLLKAFDSDLKEMAEKHQLAFNAKYNELVERKEYFFGCPFEIYKYTYQERLDSFLNTFLDANERDFINYELDKGILSFEYEIHGTISKTIYFSLQKRLDFLKERAVELGFEIDIFSNDSKSDTYIIKKIDSENTPLIDFSDSKGPEKIVMLNQLGILDFLKSKQPFIQSTNKLAEAISGFTGEKAGTIQSYINPMNNPTSSQKNNPMTKQNVVSKVNQKLISIGYNPPE